MHRFPAQTDSLTTIDESKPRMMNFSLEKKIFREKIFCSMLDWSLCVNPFHCYFIMLLGKSYIFHTCKDDD